jgi:hypothetical protein
VAESYKVIFVGIKPGQLPSEAMTRLARLFRTEPDQIQMLLRSTPRTVKTGLSLDEARKYRAALDRAGAEIRIEAEGQAAVQPAPAAEPGPLATCPNCGYAAFNPNDTLVMAHQGRGECPKCGVIREKSAEKRKPAGPPPKDFFAPLDEDEELSPAPEAVVVPDTGRRRHLWAGLALVVLILAVWALWPSETEPPPPIPLAEKPAAADDGAEENTCTILMGETRTLTLTDYAPVVHPAGVDRGLKMAVAAKPNPYTHAGVDVRIDAVRLSTELFEFHRMMADGRDWRVVPDFPRITVKSVPAPAGGQVDLILADDVRRLMAVGRLDALEFKRKLAQADLAASTTAKETYKAYRVDVDFTVAVPDDSDRFRMLARHPQRGAVMLVMESQRMAFQNRAGNNPLDARFRLTAKLSPHRTGGNVQGLDVTAPGLTCD